MVEPFLRARAATIRLALWAAGLSVVPGQAPRDKGADDLLWSSYSWTSVATDSAACPSAATGGRQTSRRAAGVAGLLAMALPLMAAPAANAATPLPVRRVVVRAEAGQLAQAERAVRRVGGHLDRELRLIDAVAATIPSSAGPALAGTPGVREVSDNAAVTLATDASGYSASNDANSLYNIENVTGARQRWSKGFTGKGVDVALVDSGVAPVAGIKTNNLVYGPDLTPESQNANTANLDTYGHGTHLAGIIAGHDAAVSDVTTAITDSTDFLGVAPDARVLSVKVADYHGNSDVSQVIAGIDWVVQHGHDSGLNVRVLNLSFGTDSAQAYTSDPLAYAAEQAWKHGIVVVTSAGNTGATSGRMTDPATDPYVLAVGADDTQGSTATQDDTIPAFSSTGDGVRNPDLVAPGVHVPSLRVPGSYVDVTYGATGQLGDRFFRGSGTSQAAAVVSGSVALLLQQYPTLTPDQVKSLLVGNANPLPAASVQAQGAGLITLRNITGTPLPVAQTFLPATGTGTLEASRGSTHLMLRDSVTGLSTALTGERDLFGAPVSTPLLAAAEATATSWTGGTFNGNSWTGSAWSSSAWASSAWASSAWASSSWAGSAWASSAWASSAWASSAWASSSWASSAWASSAWASSAWASSAWASSAWASSSWS